MIAGCSRQAAQQMARHGYLKWLRAQYRREVVEGASKYPGLNIGERHQAYVQTVRADLMRVPAPNSQGRLGRPMVQSKWHPSNLAKILEVELAPGDTLATVFERWATAEFSRFTKLVQVAKEKAAQAGKPLKAVLRTFVDAVYPPWVRAPAGWGRHRYGSGFRDAGLREASTA